jgi:hypothetical protein
MIVPVKLIAPIAVTEVTPVEIEAPVPRFAKLIVCPVAVKLLKGTTPPIVPCKETVPAPPVRVIFLPAISPFNVPVIVMFPPLEERVTSFTLFRLTFPVRIILLLVVVILPPKLIAPVRSVAFVVVMAPVCTIDDPVTVSDESVPTAPDIVTTPPVSVKVWDPVIVLEKEIFPVVVLIVTGPVRVTAPVINTGLLLVVTLPPKLIGPV